MTQPPKNWIDCEKLLTGGDLDLALQVRLVQLAFADQGSVAVKAIEMLRTLPRVAPEDSIVDDLTDDELIEAERRAEAFLKKFLSDYANQEDASE